MHRPSFKQVLMQWGVLARLDAGTFGFDPAEGMKMSTRQPAVAGQFYPGEAKLLRESVERYMKEAGVAAAPSQVVCLVAPHAGYIYSGPAAGHAFARVRGKTPSRVLLLGCSHRYTIPRASVYAEGAFAIPGAEFPIDEPFAAEAAAEAGDFSTQPHIAEHSIEVQLPFLFNAIGIVPIVPILFGGPPEPWHAEYGRKLATLADPGDLVIASTDLSHYLAQDDAEAIDTRTIDAILARDTLALSAELRRGACSMCGGAAVVAAMGFATQRGAGSWSLLDYRTSAKASGDYTRVVGYAAISMETAA
jgi:hypothetical protein